VQQCAFLRSTGDTVLFLTILSLTLMSLKKVPAGAAMNLFMRGQALPLYQNAYVIVYTQVVIIERRCVIGTGDDVCNDPLEVRSNTAAGRTRRRNGMGNDSVNRRSFLAGGDPMRSRSKGSEPVHKLMPQSNISGRAIPATSVLQRRKGKHGRPS
jgi:hypothetical protein